MEDVVDRYAAVGGLAGVVSKFGCRELSLHDVAKRVGVSRETVRKDVRLYVGDDGYAELLEKRRRSNPTLRRCLSKGLMNGQEALDFIRSHPDEFDDPDGMDAVVSLILRKAEEFGAKVDCLAATECRLKYFVAVGKIVSIRTVVPIPGSQVGGTGIVRVKAGKLPEERDMMLVVAMSDPMVPYILPKKVVLSVKTLCLRYSRFDRTSVYDEYRDAWNRIFGATSPASVMAG